MKFQITLEIEGKSYIKDPQQTQLGLQILKHSIELIDEIGFEEFTFKKLALRIESTEASIYRYFESKYYLLIYLNAWYWSWIYYKIHIRTFHTKLSTKEKLLLALKLLIEKVENDHHFPHIEEVKLKNIIEREGKKSILTQQVDAINKEGCFNNYKELVSLLSDWILEINPQYKYPNMLITTLIEGAHLQHFFIEHLPRLTNNSESEDSVASFILDVFTQQLNIKQK